MQEGDVVRFDYTLWIKGESKPLDTSMDDVAEKEGIARPQKAYKPLTVTLGRQQVLPALEAKLPEAKEGKPMKVDLAAKDAYGERDPSKLRDIPMGQFRKQKVDPKPGMELNFEGQRALVTRVAGGRVRIDMNHDLAGKDLVYEITLRGIVTDPQEKLDAVCDNLFPMGGHKIRVDGDKVILEVPDQVKFDQSWGQHKFRVVTELRAVADDSMAIVLQETFPAMPSQVMGGEEE